MTKPVNPASGPPGPKGNVSPPANEKDKKLEMQGGELSIEDFYYEGLYVVFTRAYHLKRGYCCNSNCRHCPYK
jgi:hypothetical protein